MMKTFKFVVAVSGIALLMGCTNPDKARSILSSQGYTKITITGYNFWACSEDDFYHTGFKAIAPNGTLVEGTVCERLLFKGATVRM